MLLVFLLLFIKFFKNLIQCILVKFTTPIPLTIPPPLTAQIYVLLFCILNKYNMCWQYTLLNCGIHL